MSTNSAAAARNPNRPQGMRGPGHMMGGAGMPAEKSLDFWPSAKRLLRRANLGTGNV